jgi:hypothetical protein
MPVSVQQKHCIASRGEKERNENKNIHLVPVLAIRRTPPLVLFSATFGNTTHEVRHCGALAEWLASLYLTAVNPPNRPTVRLLAERLFILVFIVQEPVKIVLKLWTFFRFMDVFWLTLL